MFGGRLKESTGMEGRETIGTFCPFNVRLAPNQDGVVESAENAIHMMVGKEFVFLDQPEGRTYVVGARGCGGD